uniref:Peptidase A1 domain-containing protein n=1 Tax=Fagus sylvatica TaxID=28930 RepID=A0A2N9HNR3_FAGSY
MASSFHFLLLCSLLFLISSQCIAKTSFHPKALVLPITKDSSTLQYLTHINQRTPLVPIKLTLDLGGQFLWVDCEKGYVSSTFKPVQCNTSQCKLARSGACIEACYSAPKPGCNNNTCSLLPDNTVTHTSSDGELSQDVVSIQSTDGSNPGTKVSMPNLLFTCGSTSLLKGLTRGVKGMAGLGRTMISLPYQFSAAFRFHRKFAICLSSSTRSNGVMFFGDGPYVLLPNIDVSKSLIYTPLIKNPVSTASSYFKGEPSAEYFIKVRSIKINGKVVPLNTSLLAINKAGDGGTKISSVNPYTVLETSIYNAFVGAFIKGLAKIPRVASVAPFGACFSSKNIGSTRVGPAVPQIDLVLQSNSVYWRIFGANSMVQVSSDVLCLGFVDGGSNPTTSIVIGGHQLEDNLLQFDLATSRLGFSSSLLFRQTTCANFNFTSHS